MRLQVYEQSGDILCIHHIKSHMYSPLLLLTSLVVLHDQGEGYQQPKIFIGTKIPYSC